MRRVGLKVLVIYSEKFGAEIAARACNALRTHLGRQFQVSQTVWNTELFKSAKLRLLAAREAMEADLVFMAMPEGSPLEPDVETWLSLWEKRGRAGNAALVALLKRDSIEAPHSVCERLQDFARTARMDFFCHSEVQPGVLESVGEGAIV